jgi:phosphoribosylaminoimidazole carboxylase (NCAIR synthetase)
MDKKQFDVGIIGGGQLARMLVLKAHEMGLSATSLVESSRDPSALVGHHLVGKPESTSDIKKFFALAKVITFESEFVECQGLLALTGATEKSPGAVIFPRPELMQLIRDRKYQKSLLDQHRIPTARWYSLDEAADINQLLGADLEPAPGQNLSLALSLATGRKTHTTMKPKKQSGSKKSTHFQRLVIKQRLFGYDGLGTKILKTQKELEMFQAELSKENSALLGKETQTPSTYPAKI